MRTTARPEEAPVVGEHGERDDDRTSRTADEPDEAIAEEAASQPVGEGDDTPQPRDEDDVAVAQEAAKPLTEDEAAVLAVNRRFYEAFEAGDLETLADLCEQSERAVCTHPGWVTIRGWSAVIESWEAIVNGGGPPQFILTNEHATVQGDVAWATVEENLIGRRGTSGTVAGLNILVRGDDGKWRIVVHHGAHVAPRPPS